MSGMGSASSSLSTDEEEASLQKLIEDEGFRSDLSEEEKLACMLRNACCVGDGKRVERLLCAGANLDTRDDEGCTPLHTACWSNEPTIAQLLLMYDDTIIDAVDAHESAGTALQYASVNGFRKVVRILVAADVLQSHGFDTDWTAWDVNAAPRRPRWWTEPYQYIPSRKPGALTVRPFLNPPSAWSKIKCRRVKGKKKKKMKKLEEMQEKQRSLFLEE